MMQKQLAQRLEMGRRRMAVALPVAAEATQAPAEEVEEEMMEMDPPTDVGDEIREVDGEESDGEQQRRRRRRSSRRSSRGTDSLRRKSSGRSSWRSRTSSGTTNKMKRGSIIDAIILDDIKGSKGKRGAVVAIYIHGSIFLSVCALLLSINALSVIFSGGRSPWSLYVVLAWGSALGIHFGITWSILWGTDSGTEELDDLLERGKNMVLWALRSFDGIFLRDFNPFPSNSRLARLYDYLLLGIEPDDDY